jgi:hypothetical protein
MIHFMTPFQRAALYHRLSWEQACRQFRGICMDHG